MSGGYFEYQCFHVSQFADRLQTEIDSNVNSYFREDTIKGLQAIQQFIEMAGELARETEWLYSGDTTQITFNETIDNILKKYINIINEYTGETEFHDNPNKEKE